MARHAVTIDEWREQNLPHFTACEEILRRHFDAEIMRVAELLDLETSLFLLSSRVKRATSAAKTAERRHRDYWKLPDWVGVRLSCPTLESAYHLSVSANTLNEWNVGKRIDYNLEPKIEGYRGIHVYGNIERGESRKVRVYCEIQILTRLQSLWSDLTHDEVYKPEETVSILSQDTAANLAAYMAATDQLIERMFKILRKAEEQMRPSEAAEIKYWIAVIALLDPSLDWYAIEPLINALKAQGLTKPVQLQILRNRFTQLQDIVVQKWISAGRPSPSAIKCIEVITRLIVEYVNRDDELRKLERWAREEAEAYILEETMKKPENQDVQ